MTPDKSAYKAAVLSLRPTMTDAEFDDAWALFLTAQADPAYDPAALIGAALMAGLDAVDAIDATAKGD